MTLFTWSKTAAANATADSTINWAEGQAASSVNNSARAEMAAVAKWRDDNNGTLTTAGSSTAYTLTTNQIFTSLAAGRRVCFRFDEANGASPTLNVDGLGAKALRAEIGVELSAGDYKADDVVTATYHTDGAGQWIIHRRREPEASATVPGRVELATSAETITGTDTGRAVTPKGLKDRLDDGITTAGELLTSSATDLIGYATGSGGTVNQATNKGTNVTLNKSNGRIVMDGAALASGAEVTFKLNNNLISNNDFAAIHHMGTGTGGAYLVQIVNLAAGECTISVRNVSAGSLSQAIELRFIIFKSGNT